MGLDRGILQADKRNHAAGGGWRVRDETRQEYQRIITALGERGADCVALACTEIPLLLKPKDAPLPAFSTTELHCEAAVALALAGVDVQGRLED